MQEITPIVRSTAPIRAGLFKTTDASGATARQMRARRASGGLLNNAHRPAELVVHNVHVLDPEPGLDPGPLWFTDALRLFRENVGHKEYPCHFGRRALEQHEMFVTSVEGGDLSPLPAALAAFLDYAAPTPERRQVMAAFVQLAQPDLQHSDYDHHFWEILRYLHEHDTCPWPGDIPQSTDDPAWEYSFHGTPMFVFAAAPTHVERRSRNLGECLILLFQPRNVFVGIEGGTKPGIAARRRIRDRLARWDTADAHPSMGDYGDPSNFEWRQYFIPDDQSDMRDSCPFQH